MSYLSISALEGLKQYDYKRSARTSFDKFFNSLLWEPLSKLYPNWLAPNLLTLFGTFTVLMVLGYALTYTSLDLTVKPPNHIWVLATIGMLIYEIIDNTDGKLARRLGLSSPLGHLFDSGLNSIFNTSAVALLTSQCLGMKNSYETIVLLMILQTPFYFAAWEELHVGGHRIQVSNLGVSEMAMILKSACLFSVCFRYDFWYAEIIYGIKMKEFFVSIFVLIYIWVLPACIANVILEKKNASPLKEFFPIIQIIIGVLLLYNTAAYQSYSLIIILNICAALGLVSSNMIVCSCTKKGFEWLRSDSTLFLLYSLLTFVIQIEDFWVHVGFGVALWFILLHYLVSVVLEISRHLGIPILRVTRQKHY
ncbi:unnamed protein product [Blepharisma stoltei]|uniref:Ethanolaminephosphotransferase n=1 Tax=Blepharisma stoltei TaxID=1481888 RepID=A0AAU9J048_9CILI|nr:unnamed protein product [Blepharisma stoltei]